VAGRMTYLGQLFIAYGYSNQGMHVFLAEELTPGPQALGPEEAMSPEEVAARLAAEPEALVLGPAVADYRAALESRGVAPARLLEVASFPSAVALAHLVRFPEQQSLEALFALEPHYVRASEPERNPKFPPLPGPAPTARLKED